jgi:uncharacterized membrane protein
MIINVFKRIIILSFFLCTIATPLYAQETVNIQRAKVIEITKEEKHVILEGFSKEGVDIVNQTLTALIVDGPEKGTQVTLENDYIRLDIGDTFFIEKGELDGRGIYSVKERDRQIPILMLLIIFAIAIVIFGGKQGLRSLLSLTGSFVVIACVLLPLLAQGYSPIFVSVVVATIILFTAIYFTHGFNRESPLHFRVLS